MKVYLLLACCFVLVLNSIAQPLPRSTPEAQGVSSQNIIQFLDAASSSNHEFHSIMIVRHGKVIAEGWWNPYKADIKHTLYSCSKSFTATAVGFAVSEGRLSVQDTVLHFFPDKAPANPDPKLAALKVKDLLTMTVGQAPDPIGVVAVSDDWIKTFFEVPVKEVPGTKFLYNSAATYMLSAIVQKVTGQKIIDYLKPRLFDPLGITGMDWEVDPDGINVGGWGLRVKTEDMAKFALLFLQKGKWNGKQIVPESWVQEASTAHIMQLPEATPDQKSSNDWIQGYGYQMWRSRNNTYRGDGAFGQYMLVFPDQDAVIAITSETPDMQGIMNLVFKHLLPAFGTKKLSTSKNYVELKSRLAGLKLNIPASNNTSTLMPSIIGKSFGILSTLKTLKDVSFENQDKNLLMKWHTDSTTHSIPFGKNEWAYSETTRKGPYLVAMAQANRNNLLPFKIAGSYDWKDNNTLQLTLRYIESPHTETITCSFDGDKMTMDITHLMNQNTKRDVIKTIQQKEWSHAPKLIVRGDDMGFSHSANEAIIKSYTEGIETSIEIIAPSPWFPEAIKMLHKTKGADVGLHFAITSEWDGIKWRPLTEAKSIRNEDGFFYPMLYPNKNYPKMAVLDTKWQLEDVEKELRAQLDLAKKYLPGLSHVSGHMGSTAFTPEVKQMVKKVSAEYNIAMVDRDPLIDYGIQYIGFDFRNKNTEQRIEAFIDMLDRLEEGKTYVYVEHPGLDNEELKAIKHIGYEDVAQGRQDVTTIFTSEKVKEAIIKRGIQLVSYKDVIASKR